MWSSEEALAWLGRIEQSATRVELAISRLRFFKPCIAAENDEAHSRMLLTMHAYTESLAMLYKLRDDVLRDIEMLRDENRQRCLYRTYALQGASTLTIATEHTSTAG
jgi:hypothetical protein